MNLTTTSDRRLHPRRHLEANITYAGSEGVNCVALLDISYGGVRLRLDGPERPGARVRLGLSLGKRKLISSIHGQVVWSRQLAPFEVGIRFLALDANFVHLVSQILSAGEE